MEFVLDLREHLFHHPSEQAIFLRLKQEQLFLNDLLFNLWRLILVVKHDFDVFSLAALDLDEISGSLLINCSTLSSIFFNFLLFFFSLLVMISSYFLLFGIVLEYSRWSFGWMFHFFKITDHFFKIVLCAIFKKAHNSLCKAVPFKLLYFNNSLLIIIN